MQRAGRLVLLVFALVGSGAASATDACFDWFCTPSSCQFDTSCSTLAAPVLTYSWDMGDGNSFNTLLPVISYDYAQSNFRPKVKLNIFTAVDAASAECRITVPPVVGPPLTYKGSCT